MAATPLAFDRERYAVLGAAGEREMHIFRWLSDLDAHLEAGASQEELRGGQALLERILLELATIPTAAQARAGKRNSWLGGGSGSKTGTGPATQVLAQVPKPARAVRELVARCLVRVYDQGQMHGMGDVLYAIQAAMGSGAEAARLAALTCAGALFEALSTKAGFRLLSCFSDFAAIMLKVARTSSERIPVRAAATRALARMLRGGGGKTATEQQAREMLRVVRNNTTHRSPTLVLESLAAIEALATCTPHVRAHSAGDPEQLVSALLPLLATRVLVVRRAAARLAAVLMVCAVAQPSTAPAAAVPLRQIASPVPAPTQLHAASTPVRNSLDVRSTPGMRHATPEPADVAAVRASRDISTSPTLTAPQARSLGRVLGWLSVPFARPTASRETRAGIVDAYAALVDELPCDAVDAHYDELATHVLVDLTQRAQSPADAGEPRRQADALALRNMCAWLLRTLACRLPGAEARLRAAEHLRDRWLRSPRQTPETVAAVALDEWRELVTECRVVDDASMGVAELWLGSASEAVRIAAAAALAAMVRAAPTRRTQVVTTLAGRLQTLSAHCATQPADIDAMQHCLGYAAAVAGALSSGDGLLGVPLDLAEWVHSIAVRLLDAAHGRADPVVVRSTAGAGGADPSGTARALGVQGRAGAGGMALRNMRAGAGWALMAGLAGLGAEFARARMAQWKQLWATALPDGGFVTADASWAERAHMLHARAMALEHMRMVLLAARAALDADAAPRLIACVRATLMFADNALDAPPPPTGGAVTAGALPVRVSLPTLHLAVRARAAQCLRLMHDAGWSLAPAMPAALRLAEQAMTSADSLPETFAAQCSGAAPASDDADAVPPCLRGFRAGPWGYEAEVGVTSLLRADGASGHDFAACTMAAPERDWTQAVLPTVSGRVEAPYTQLVDAAVRLFGVLFHLLSEDAQAAQVARLVARLNTLPFNSHRHAAILTNALAALREALQGTAVVAPRMALAIADVAYATLIVPSPEHRTAAGEVIGLLAAHARDASYLPRLLDHLTQQAIRGRDRFARAGAAVALGALFARAGAIAAGSSLKQVVVLLHSLASDKDPVVHACAIRALADAAMAAGYMFAPYARDTFHMVRKLFLSDSHAAPLHASALWARGRDHTPGSAVEAAGAERVLPVRTAADPYAWAREARQQHQQQQQAHQHAQQQAQQSAGLGGLVATGRDAAITHPNSATHNGCGADDPRDAPTDGDFQFVCTRSDVDAYDARAALGRLVGALIVAFGPELHADDAARVAVVPLLRELRRALSAVVAVDSGPGAAAAALLTDPDAHWQAAAEYTAATQKQLLFFAPRDPAFLPMVVRTSLRPVLRARRVVYYGHAAGLRPLQRAAVRALENILRLNGPRVEKALCSGDAERHWPMRAIVWEALCLHSTLEAESDVLAADIRTLVCTSVGLVTGCGLSGSAPADGSGVHLLPLAATLCAVFARRPVPESSGEGADDGGGEDADGGARQFSNATKQLALAALLAMLRAADRARAPTAGAQREWRAHTMLPVLPDMLRVAYMAATAACPSTRSLGLHLVQRVVASFADVEDSASAGTPALDIYQAQLMSALTAALAEPVHQTPLDVRCAAIGAATAYVVAGLAADHASLVRILRLLAPQPAFAPLLESGGESAGARTLTPQQQLVMRLALLQAWARILDYAATGNQRLLDVVRQHIPLLARMWLACARDACVVGVSARDVYEELDALRTTAPAANGELLDAGLGLQLGLEASYVGPVRIELLACYRLYAPSAIRALLTLLLAPPGADGVLALGRGCLLELVESYDRVHLEGEPAERRPSQAAVLLLCAAVQELARHASVAGDDEVDWRVPGALGGLVDELDVCDRDLATGAATDAGRKARRAADATLLAAGLGELLDRADSLHLSAAFAATAGHSGRVPWLAEEVWRHAVAGPLRTFVSAPEQEPAVAAAGASLGAAAALIRALSATPATADGGVSLAQQWLFDASPDPGALAESGGLGQALGLSPPGSAAVRDIVSAWQAAHAVQPTIAAHALRVLAQVMAAAPVNYQDAESTPLIALWLSMWQQSLTHPVDADAAAASLAGFGRLMADTSPAQPMDMLTGDPAGQGDRAAEMANSLLAYMLTQGDTRAALLPVVASLLAGGAFVVSPTVCALFVDAYPACLAAWPARDIKPLLSVPKRLAAASAGSVDVALVLAALARDTIPILAKKIYARPDSAQPEGAAAADGDALAALVQFATAEYGAAASSGPATAAVLMVLLSMLPEDGPLSPREAPVTEAILTLAAARPLAFRDIVIRLSAAHKSAKLRLELAIRSHAPPEATADTMRTPAGGARRAEARDSTGIVLKSDFGI